MTQRVTLLIALTQLDLPVPISTQPLSLALDISSIQKEEASFATSQGRQRRRLLVCTARGYHPASHLRKSKSPELPTTRLERRNKGSLVCEVVQANWRPRTILLPLSPLSLTNNLFFFCPKKQKKKELIFA